MRKIRLFGLVLVAVCAFSAVVTASAFALTFALANWLENGNIITVEKLVETEGELLFENLSNGAAFLCSGIFDGSVGNDGIDEVTELLTLGKVAVPELDPGVSGTGIACTVENLCVLAEIWAVNLPYSTELMLDTENSLFYDLGLPNSHGLLPGYFVLCEVGGIDFTELCVTLEGVDGLYQEKSNNTTAGDVETLGAFVPEADCGSGTENGLVENNAQNIALILLTNGMPLAVSE
jgi:hypothetical protein